MKKETRKMLQALLFSKDLEAGKLAYMLINQEVPESKYPEIIEKYSKEQSEKLFIHHVLYGDLVNAKATANESNLIALKNSNVYQMLQALLVSDKAFTRGIAFEVLSGVKTIEEALIKMNQDSFLFHVLSGQVNSAYETASNFDLECLKNKKPVNFNFTLNTVQNWHRLNYIMLSQNLKLDDVINVMIKSFYETIKADEHAHRLNKELPQNYYI